MDVYIVKFDSNLRNLRAFTLLGGNNYDTVSSIVVDASGNVYVAGSTSSVDFPITPGAFKATRVDAKGNIVDQGSDAFVAKFDSNLQNLLASTFLGGNSHDRSSSITLEGSGNVYVAGFTESTDFPKRGGPFQTARKGVNDVFVAKFNSNLQNLLASTLIGGSDFDVPTAIRLDNQGDVYVAGLTGSVDFPSAPNAYDTTYNGKTDAFIVKLNNGLGQLLASTFLGRKEHDYGNDLAIDANGNIFLAGWFYSGIDSHPDFPTTEGAYDTTTNFGDVLFISKFDSSLRNLLASTYLGNAAYLSSTAIAIGGNGNVYIAGRTDVTDFPITPQAYAKTLKGRSDAFLAKLDGDLSNLLYSSYLGGSQDEGESIPLALNSNGDVYVAGHTSSSDFPTTSGAYDTSFNGGRSDAFIAKFDNDSLAGTPHISVSPATLNFGHVAVGTQSGSKRVTASNTGETPLNLGTASIIGPDSAMFRITTNECSKRTLPAGGICAFDIVFAPTVAGPKSASLSIPSNDPTKPTALIPLSGTQEYTLTINKSGNGSGTVTSQPSGISCGTTCAAHYTVGTPVTLTAQPAEGSLFGGWSDGGCSGVTSCTITLASDTAITVSFNLITHIISASSEGHGSIAPVGRAEVNHGTSQTFIIQPENGYQVTDVRVDGTSVGAVTNYTFTNVVKDHTIHAAFPIAGDPNNLALGKPARQSSNNFGTTGAEAVDGNTDGDSSHGSMSHTHPDNPPWWEVDLQALSRVDEVRIYNRTDCCAERLSNFDVMLSTDGQTWQQSVHVPGPAGRPTKVPFNGAQARYVRIQLRDITYLSLAEVEVMGTADRGKLVTNCTTYGPGPGTLQEALSGGGTVTFACSGTIIVPQIDINPDNGILDTKIDASGQNVTLSGNHANRVFYLKDDRYSLYPKLELINLKITQGLRIPGGGIANSGGVLTLVNSTVSGGGGIFNNGGSFNQGTLTLINSNVSNNSVDGGSNGGGITNCTGCTMIITDSTISGNVATGNCGGICNNGTATISNSSISDNVAYGDCCGGISNGGTLTIKNSTVSGNKVINQITGSVGGGGIGTGGVNAKLTINNSTVSGNTATNSFGGLFTSDYATTILTNSTVSGNIGGIQAGRNSTLIITNSTISDNGFDVGGFDVGGIQSIDQSTVTLANSIVANNGTSGNCIYDYGGDIIDNGYNLTDDSTCNLTASTSLPNTDPQLGSLANNGGLTQTRALLPGSPALDRIPIGVSKCGTDIAADQRGAFRPQPSGGKCDIGSFEAGVIGPPPISGNNLALGKPARQSSNNFGTTGAEAVDGNTDGDSSHGSMSHTHPDNPPWWEVDLQALSRVDEVRIYNRTDCCAERLSNFDVMLSSDGQTWQQSIHVPGPAGRPTKVPFDGAQARYVRIQLRDITYLSLAEVEVMGTALVH